MADWIAMAVAMFFGFGVALLFLLYAIKKKWPTPKDGDEV